MRLLTILPRLDAARPMRLYRRALGELWDPEKLEWSTPHALAPLDRTALANVLSPVFLGEQTAIYAASAIIPTLGARGEPSQQLYLSTLLLDEARHTEFFVRYYNRIQSDPMRLVELRDAWKLFVRLHSPDPMVWLAGILFIDTLSRRLYSELKERIPDPLLGAAVPLILRDEGRHLAFAELYLRGRLEQAASARERAELHGLVRGRVEEALSVLDDILVRLRPAGQHLGIDVPLFAEAVRDECRRRVEKMEAAD